MKTRRISGGFTLIELIMVLVILGILGVTALPRFFNSSTYDTRGFFDQAKSVLRYAQKAAIAQHRNVYVNVAANRVCLTYAADAACNSALASNHVLNPADGQWFRLSVPAGVTIAPQGSFYFNALGSPVPAMALSGTVTGDGMTYTLTVERDTGYVH